MSFVRSLKVFIDFIDEPMNFYGDKKDNLDLETFLMQFRTNSYMIAEMIELMNSKIKFTLTRPIKNIVGDFLYLLSGVEREYKYYIENNNTHSERFSEENKVFFDAHLDYIYSNTNKYFIQWLLSIDGDENFDVAQHVIDCAKSIVSKKLKSKDLIRLVKYYNDRKNRDKSLLLSTAHSSKGIGVDCVYICEDLNKATKEAIEYNDENPENRREDELYTYYVACTRAKKCLINAKLLKIFGNFYGDSMSKQDFYDLLMQSKDPLKDF